MGATNLASPTDPFAALQHIVDDLAAVLHRPVIVRDAARSYHVESGVPFTGERRLRAITADDHPEPERVDVEVAVNGRSGLLGHVVVLSDGTGLMPGGHLDALDAGVSLVREALDDPNSPAGPNREDVLSELLAADLPTRRAAYSSAVSRRWLHRGEGTVVRAVLADSRASTVLLVALGRHLSTMRPAPLMFAGVHAGMLFLVGGPADESLNERIIREAAQRGVRILGIGSASPARSAEDLRVAADEAASAAELSSSLQEFQPAVDVTALGGWLLLASSSIEPARLKSISPAAHALYFDGDDARRRTIETYLDVGANAVAACRVLFIHRTTLYYRLEKMPEVVRDALADGMKRSTLHLSLKLIRLWEASGRL